jgi:hypothetical protein
MGRPHTPVPQAARPFLRSGRYAIVPVGLLGSIAAGLAWAEGSRSFAVAITASVGLFGVSAWLAPRPYSSAPAVLAIALLIWPIRHVVPVGLLVIVLATVIVALSARRMAKGRLPSDATPDNVRRAPDDAVGVGAEEFVRTFRELGYHQVGALSFRVFGFDVIETLMIGPNADRYAEVTDAAINVVSRFGHRTLLTRNSGMTALPPGVLASDLRGADPRELDSAHDRGIEEVSPWVSPDRIERDDFVERAIEEERRSLAWARTQGRRLVASTSGLGSGPLWERSDRATAIAAWLSNDPPAST